MSVRESTFTLRIEPALRRMAERGKSVRVAAMSTGIPIADVRLWIGEFNDGAEELTLTRLNEVKHELGILAERRLAPEELPQKGAEPEKPELPAEPAKDAKPAPGDSARNEGAQGLPWRSSRRPASLARAAKQWLPVLRLYLAGAPDGVAIAREVCGVGVSLEAWWMWRRKTFGPVEAVTSDAVRDFLGHHGLLPEMAEPPPPSPRIDPDSPEMKAAEVRHARATVVAPSVMPAPQPEGGGDAASSFGDALVEIGLLIRAYRQAREDKVSYRHIHGGLLHALVDAVALAGKEGA